MEACTRGRGRIRERNKSADIVGFQAGPLDSQTCRAGKRGNVLGRGKAQARAMKQLCHCRFAYRRGMGTRSCCVLYMLLASLSMPSCLFFPANLN